MEAGGTWSCRRCIQSSHYPMFRLKCLNISEKKKQQHTHKENLLSGDPESDTGKAMLFCPSWDKERVGLTSKERKGKEAKMDSTPLERQSVHRFFSLVTVLHVTALQGVAALSLSSAPVKGSPYLANAHFFLSLPACTLAVNQFAFLIVAPPIWVCWFFESLGEGSSLPSKHLLFCQLRCHWICQVQGGKNIPPPIYFRFVGWGPANWTDKRQIHDRKLTEVY